MDEQVETVELVVLRTRMRNRRIMLATIPTSTELGPQKIRVKDADKFRPGDRLFCRRAPDDQDLWELAVEEPKGRRQLQLNKEEVQDAGDERGEHRRNETGNTGDAGEGKQTEGHEDEGGEAGAGAGKDSRWGFLRRLGGKGKEVKPEATGPASPRDSGTSPRQEFLQGSSAEERRTHNAEDAGSTPAPATRGETTDDRGQTTDGKHRPPAEGKAAVQ